MKTPARAVLSVGPSSMVGMALTDTEIGMLGLERYWWQYAGEKERMIRERFGLSATQYYQRLARLIVTEDAIAHDPVTCNRLRRVMEYRQLQRRTECVPSSRAAL